MEARISWNSSIENVDYFEAFRYSLGDFRITQKDDSGSPAGEFWSRHTSGAYFPEQAAVARIGGPGLRNVRVDSGSTL